VLPTCCELGTIVQMMRHERVWDGQKLPERWLVGSGEPRRPCEHWESKLPLVERGERARGPLDWHPTQRRSARPSAPSAMESIEGFEGLGRPRPVPDGFSREAAAPTMLTVLTVLEQSIQPGGQCAPPNGTSASHNNARGNEWGLKSETAARQG
jgi:hypothetical protein